MSTLYRFSYRSASDVEFADMLDDLVDAYASPAALARVLGVGRPTVYDWRKGARPRPEARDRIVYLHEHLVGATT